MAKEALALGKFRDWNPDFIILEVLMGGKSANNIISRVRQTPNGKTTPIILFSNTDKEALKNISIHQKASHIESARKACLEAGATDSIGGFEETAFLTFIKNQLTIS